MGLRSLEIDAAEAKNAPIRVTGGDSPTNKIKGYMIVEF
jgi:hypothetical protein